MAATTTQNGQPKTRQRNTRRNNSSSDRSPGHRILDGAKRYGSAMFNNTSRFFGTDKEDLVGSYYRQIVDLVFVLGVMASLFVSWYFAPAGYKIFVAPLIFMGLFAVEWAMHGAGRIIVQAACTDTQKKWMIAVVIVGGLFIFTDTILFIQSFTDKGGPISQWLMKYTSFLTGGEAIVMLFLFTKAISLDDRRNAVMYHNGATAQGFRSSVEDALDHVRLIGEYNAGVRSAHRTEKGLAVTALIKALTTRAAKSKRKGEANTHAQTMAEESMKLVSRKPEDLRADLLSALDDLNKSNVELPSFSNALPDYSKN